MSFSRKFLMFAVLVLFCLPVFAQHVPNYVYQTVDVPPTFPIQGTVVSQGVNAINDNGTAAGAVETDRNQLVNYTFTQNAQGGFLFSPLFASTGVVRGINNQNDFSGFDTLSLPGGSTNTGFVTDSTPNSTTHILQAPGCNLTEMIGLNDKANQLSVGDARCFPSSTFVGVVFRGPNFLKFVTANSNGGFVMSFRGLRVGLNPSGKFAKFADADQLVETALTGVNNSGEMVGFFGDPVGSRPLYIHKDGTQDADLEGILAGLPGISGPALPADINNKSHIVGFYIKGASISGFLVKNGKAFEIAYPGADATEPSGINSNGQIVGSYVAGGVRHGFLATQVNSGSSTD